MLTSSTLLLGIVLSGFAPEPRDNPIFAADAKPELLFERSAPLNSGLTEGPATAPDGTVYFTDLPFGAAQQTMIHRYDPRTGKVTLFTDKAGKANGLAFGADGSLLACEGAEGGGRCVSKWNVRTGKKSVVADRFRGHRFNAPNDLCVDHQGRIYFTDPRYLGSEPRELEHRAVYRVDRDGSVVEITHDVEMPNGIVLSPDERTLYVGDHNAGVRLKPSDPPPKRGAMRLYAFGLDANGLVHGARRTLIDFGEQNGCDGITVDASGNIYVSCRSLAKPGVMVIDPKGNRLAFLQTGPTNQTGSVEDWHGVPSNVEFGIGKDQHSLYLTIDKALYRVPTKQHGPPAVWAHRNARAP